MYSLRYPKLYTPGHLDLLFNKRVFVRSVAEGILTSLVLFFMPYFAFYNAIKPNGQDIAGHRAFGTIVSSSLIVTVTLRVRSSTCTRSLLGHLSPTWSFIFDWSFICYVIFPARTFIPLVVI